MTPQAGLVVIGAGGTLGSAFCNAHKRRAHIYAFDKISNPQARIEECDLGISASIEKALKQLPYQSFEMWRVLVTSGIYDGTTHNTQSWSDIRESLNINLIGVTQFVTGFVECLQRTSKQARIVVVSSASARVGSHDIGYGVAKAGLEGLIRSISKRYAPNGVSAIGVAPSLFESAMSAKQDVDRRNKAINATHLLRSIRLEEVLTCVSFAVFDAPDALTGTFISPNGGQVSA